MKNKKMKIDATPKNRFCHAVEAFVTRLSRGKTPYRVTALFNVFVGQVPVLSRGHAVFRKQYVSSSKKKENRYIEGGLVTA
jgi:hypothetical protein